MVSKAMMWFLLAVNLCLSPLTNAGMGMTGLGGGVDAIKQVLDECTSHQCYAMGGACVKCDEWRDECANAGDGDSVDEMKMNCALERSNSIKYCMLPMNVFISTGLCSKWSVGDFKAKMDTKDFWVYFLAGHSAAGSALGWLMENVGK